MGSRESCMDSCAISGQVSKHFVTILTKLVIKQKYILVRI